MSFEPGLPDIRIIIREATDENLTVDVPNISVKVQQADQYNVNITPNSVTALRTGSFSSYADLAGLASTASYALVAQTLIGSIESSSYAFTSSYVEYDDVGNKPTLVSSSTQIDYTQLQNQPTTIPTASYVLNAASSSFALTASYVSGAASTWDTIANKPIGLVSSSTQATTWTVATASVATTASFAPTILPSGTVSSSTQINTGSFSGSFVGTLTGTSSWAQISISSSFALTASYVSGAASTWDTITNKPAGLVSSSTQAISWTVASASVATTALTASYISGTINFPDGLSVTGSVTATGGFIGTASFALTASYVSGAASSWDTISGKPSGLVSSSAQATTWTVATASLALTASYFDGNVNFPNGLTITGSTLSSGGFTGSLLGTSSWAVSSSFAPTILPSGTVSSSLQINTGSFSGSFIGTLTGTSSWASNVISSSYALTASYVSGAAGSTVSSSYALTSSYALVAQNVLGSITSASYAATASYVQGYIKFENGLTVTGSIISTGGFTGSLSGSISNAVSSSYASTSSITEQLTKQNVIFSSSIGPIWTTITSGSQHLSDGTYAVTANITTTPLDNLRLSGIFSWYIGSVSSDDTDELFLQRTGRSSATASIFMRTQMISASGTFLQIFSDYTLPTEIHTFTFVKLI